MIITCPSCKSKYKFDDAKLEGVASKKVKCPKCKAVIEIPNPNMVSGSKAKGPLEGRYSSMTPSSADMTSALAQMNDPNGPGTAEVKYDAMDEKLLKMPTGRRFSLAVIQGNNQGEIYQISRPRMILGRSDSDIIVQDIEASRQHARVEVMGDRVILRDLGSTNGTFVNEAKITAVNLENQSEFRIGTTILMLIISDQD